MATSIARETLDKARYFLKQATAAECIQPISRLAFAANLEAAIVYGHATWDHISAEFARDPQFLAWKKSHFDALAADPLYAFISEGRRGQPLGLRQFIIHRGGERLSLTAAVLVAVTMRLQVSLRKVVIRAQPWYRRSLNILISDATYPIREWYHNFKSELRKHQTRDAGGAVVENFFYFDDPNWKSKPAREFVADYLLLMEREIEDAEKKFA
jgi:hypothetical protein